MFEAIIFVSILFVFLTTFVFWCCEKKRDLDTRIIGGAFIAYCFISVFAQLYLLPILVINEWDKRLSLQIQFTALAIGLTAAIIAFRNYQRKSGYKMHYMLSVQNNAQPPYISEIIIYNEKDKASAILAIDCLILDTGERIRIFQKLGDPIIVPAYSSYAIKLKRAYKYTNNYVPNDFQKQNLKLICITQSGPVKMDPSDIKELTGNFRRNIQTAQTMNDIPEDCIAPICSKATHWLSIIESYPSEYGGDMDIKYYTLMGYFKSDILYIVPEPTVEDRWYFLHKKSKPELNRLKISHLGSEMNYYLQVPDMGLIDYEKIKFTIVDRLK